MKKYALTLILIAIGVCNFAVYSVIGSSVNAQGILVEPFFLIPIGYIFIGAGMIAGLIICVHALAKDRKSIESWVLLAILIIAFIYIAKTILFATRIAAIS